MEEGEIKKRVEAERESLLQHIQSLLEIPMLILSFVWLVLFVVELAYGLSGSLQNAVFVIWGLFAADFVFEFVVAPRKLVYLRHNAITLFALLLPALRIFRLARFVWLLRTARAARGMRLAALLGSANRGFKALRGIMRHRGLGYVLLLTLLVTFLGAGGMTALEGGRFNNFWFSLWWTAMIMTTMGSQEWPVTPEGRILCLCLAFYAFAMFGYLTASIASFFLGGKSFREQPQDPRMT